MCVCMLCDGSVRGRGRGRWQAPSFLCCDISKIGMPLTKPHRTAQKRRTGWPRQLGVQSGTQSKLSLEPLPRALHTMSRDTGPSPIGLAALSCLDEQSLLAAASVSREWRSDLEDESYAKAELQAARRLVEARRRFAPPFYADERRGNDSASGTKEDPVHSFDAAITLFGRYQRYLARQPPHVRKEQRSEHCDVHVCCGDGSTVSLKFER